MYLPQSDQDGRGIELKARHGVTDCACCGVFILASFAALSLYLWSLSHGHVARLYRGSDHRGNVCGLSTEVLNAPYVYWCPSSNGPDGLELLMHKPICVSSCPGPEAVRPGLLAPISRVEPGCADIGGPEGMASYRTSLARGRYCLPTREEHPELRRRIIDMYLAGRADSFMETVASIPQAMHVLVVAFFLAVALGYTYLGLLRSCSEALIRLTLVVTMLGLCVLGWRLRSASMNVPAGGTSPSIALTGHAGIKGEAMLLRLGAWVAWLLAALLACVAFGLKAKTLSAAACVEVSCEAMLEMRCSLLVLPLVRALLEAALAPAMLHGLLLLLSCVEADSTIFIGGLHCPKGPILAFYSLASLWFIGFLHALYQFMVAYSLAEYYYTPYDHDDEKDVGCCTVWDGFTVGLLCHAGSLALGSLLITLLLPFDWLAHSTSFIWRTAVATGNQALSCLCCSCGWTARCWKTSFAYVNKNAYIDMVITSHSFCHSARQAQQLLNGLGGSVAALNGATDLLSLFGSAAIVLATAFVVSSRGALTDPQSAFHVTDPVATLVVSMLVAARVMRCFMSLLDVSSDTLLYCYGVDLQSGKGSHTAPEALKHVVHAHEED